MYWNLLSVFANCLWIYFVYNLGHFIIKLWAGAAGTSEKHVCVFSKSFSQSSVFPLLKMRNMSGTVIAMKHDSVQNTCVFPLTTCEMTLSEMASSLEKLSHIVSSQVMLMLQKRCLENPWNLFDVLFQCVCERFCLEQFWRCGVQNIHRSFVGWPGLELRIPTTSVVLPRRLGLCARRLRREAHSCPDGFPEKSAWGDTPLHVAARNGRVAAAELLLSKGAAVDAKRNDCPGPQSGKHGGQTSSLSNLGHFKKFAGAKFREKCLHFQ